MIAEYRNGASVLAVVVGLALCLWATDAFSQRASTGKLGGGADLSIVSKYVWRGYVQNDDVAAQPDFYLTYGNFTASIWGSLDMTDRGDTGIDSEWEFSEIDYVLQYTIPARLVNLSFGYSMYTYPNTPDELRESTQELYVKGAFKAFLDPTIELYYDVDEVEGWYGRVSGTYTQAQDSQEWKLRGSIGFASDDFCDYYFGSGRPIIDSSSFCDLEVRLFTTFDLGGNFGLTPFAAFSYLLDSELRDAYDDNGEFYGGLTVSWMF
ncbi:hypothetical protein HQ563_07810 [bacterium]|nr:hypothetical protein [bacterium]